MTRAERIALALILLAAAIIRFATLDHQSFDHDEAATAIRVLHANLGDTLSAVNHLERSPPLYYVLAWIWSKLFGVGEVGLRSLSALVGTATVPAAFLAARELGSRRGGLIAAGLVAVNPYLVWYSQEARSYALFVLFAAWARGGLRRAVAAPADERARAEDAPRGRHRQVVLPQVEHVGPGGQRDVRAVVHREQLAVPLRGLRRRSMVRCRCLPGVSVLQPKIRPCSILRSRY